MPLAVERHARDLHGEGRIGIEADGVLRAETLSGEIRARLPKSPDAVVSLKTFSGELTGDYAGATAGVREIEKTLGAGSGRIELNSFSGDIYLGK